MAKSHRESELQTLFLFEPVKLPECGPQEPEVRQPSHPIWTQNKAKLIERYLYYFVLITKHGTYIDGFAGPQQPEKSGTWAAKLVLENNPRWFRQFYLFDKDKTQIDHLNAIKSAQLQQETDLNEPRRTIDVHHGDFNILVHGLLRSGSIKQTEATFCLLDQRTFECHWSTLEALARYKTSSHKIELLYFLPNSWLDRALTAQKDTKALREWWGRDDWHQLRNLKSSNRAAIFVERFKRELGYRSVKAWPIYERDDGGNTMYFMIHATDHHVAPDLMYRAYRQAVRPEEAIEQLLLEFDSLLS